MACWLRRILTREVFRACRSGTIIWASRITISPTPERTGASSMNCASGVWPGRRSRFAPLTGKEPGLAGWWNFDDGTARDASPGAHHGKLSGQVVVVPATLPAAIAAPTVMVRGSVTAPGGRPLRNAEVRLLQDGVV